MTTWQNDARKVRLMDWLLTLPQDRDPKTLAALAAELDVSPRSIRGWKQEKAFRDEWEKRAKEAAGDPERVQMVLNALYVTAINGDHPQHVSAANGWLKAVDAIAPPKVTVSKAAAEKLTDEELLAAIADGARLIAEDRAKTLAVASR